MCVCTHYALPYDLLWLCVGGTAVGGEAKRLWWAKKYVHSKDQWNVWSTGWEISTVGHVCERSLHSGIFCILTYW